MALRAVDGTSYVGEHVDWSWLWWIPVVVVGIIALAYLIGSIAFRAARSEAPSDPADD